MTSGYSKVDILVSFKGFPYAWSIVYILVMINICYTIKVIRLSSIVSALGELYFEETGERKM